jgi:hypothetical protein
MWDQAEQALNQSMARLLSQVASLLPGILALIVALLVSVLAAWILAYLLRRSLAGIHFDERLFTLGLRSWAEWSPSKSPTILATQAVFWVVIFVGFLIGIAAFDATWTSQFVQSFFAYLPNLLGAALVLLVGGVVARFLGRSVLIGAVNLNLQYARLLSVGVKWLVIVLATAMALEHLKIGAGVVQLGFGILFGGIVLALALAVGLGSKDLVARSLEREASKPPVESIEEPFRHM